jgi:hypothetical protein
MTQPNPSPYTYMDAPEIARASRSMARRWRLQLYIRPHMRELAAGRHAEVFPGAHCVSDGKWVTFYKDGEEIWACNAVYAAAHFDSSNESNACASTAD